VLCCVLVVCFFCVFVERCWGGFFFFYKFIRGGGFRVGLFI